jgi:antitoxin HicB
LERIQARAKTVIEWKIMRKRLPRNAVSEKSNEYASQLTVLARDEYLPEVEAIAAKRLLVLQLSEAMRAQKKSKLAMAQELGTSRSQLARLLDPENITVSLETITRATNVLGKRLLIVVADPPAHHKQKISRQKKVVVRAMDELSAERDSKQVAS